MSLRKSARRFVILSAITLTGLTMFHKFVEQKSTSRSVKEATSQYISLVQWFVQRMGIFGATMRSR